MELLEPQAEPIQVLPAAVAVEPVLVESLETQEEEEESVAFECNICYELSREPVVTYCGHLYCWPCLYRWLQLKDACQTCPVCKAAVDKDKVIPIYGRGGGNNSDPRKKTQDDWTTDPLGTRVAEPIPNRPPGLRYPVVERGQIPPQLPGGVPQSSMSGMSFIPALFGVSPNPGPGGVPDPLTPEQQHQAFLSRLLLMLGSFVIMCLLLF